ncbi:FANCM protein, partial [Atractosteus spatula]|nr:FANCM protein [Atractosteus spatula]
MSSGKQRTLFQTWGSTVQQNPGHPDLTARGKRPTGRRKAGTTPAADCWNGDEDDDDLMLVAVYEAEKSLESLQSASERDDGRADPGIAAGSEDLPGFDRSSADIWIYPTNYPVREYQLKISETALFQNTLVCLPTGLGKTFIASVVMYNFYRWYPSSKIVFMAPTKPLVAQQIEACYKVMGIPQDHMAELTGSTQAQTRKEIWRSRRVFFLTPQVKCVVIDEAHKALGNHAYCQVVRELWNQTQQFRVLALSATPGSDARAVQQVISNLLISHIELRSEESPDIQPYSHQRSLEKMVVPLGEELAGYQARYLLVLEKFTSRLTQLNVLSQRDIRNLTKYQLILARDQFRNIPPSHIGVAQQGVLEGDFALCISLYHGYELLLQMGLRSLFLFVQGIMDGSKEMPRARNELLRNQDFMELYQEMEAKFLKPSRAPPAVHRSWRIPQLPLCCCLSGPEEPFLYSHPKLRKLEEVVLEHFRSWSERTGLGGAEGAADRVCTRVMIFSSFRESVQEIAAMLSRHQPLVRVMTFMGHGQRLDSTYNQSQSNKRSIYKSIMGSKQSFRMYTQSPRLLPEGVRPSLHKMFITSGQFEHRQTYLAVEIQHAQGFWEGSLHGVLGFWKLHRKEKRGCLSLGLRYNCLSHCCRNRGWNAVGCSVKDDGLLSPEELSLWNSSLRLEEEEPQPTLPRSCFLSLKSEPPDGECNYELELMPYLKKEDVIGCKGSNLHPVRSKQKRSSSSSIDMEEVDRDFRTPGVSVSKQKSSVSMPESAEKSLSSEDAQAINEPEGRGMESEPSETFQAGDIESECIIIPDKRKDPGAGSADHCSSPELEALHESAKLSPHIGYANKTDESCSDIEAMFYLPKCTTFSFEKCPDKEIPHNVKVILANVKELLERSPPPEPDLDFDLEAAEVNKRPSGHAVRKACSPSWDVIFDEVPEENPTHDEQDMDCRNSKLQLQAGTPGDGNDKATGEQYCQSHSLKADPKDESIDLFEDDDLFLQVSVPDPVVSADKSPRPNAPAGPVGEADGFERDELACRDLTVQEKTAFGAEGPTAPYPCSAADQQQLPQDEGQYNCSQELFSVNFDLGFSMEESEDELLEKGIASPQGAKESASSSATPTSKRAAETWLIPNQEKHGSSSEYITDQDQTASTPTPFATLTSPRGSGKLFKRTQASRPDPSFLGSKLWSPLKGHTKGHLKRSLLKAAGPTSENRPSDPLHKERYGKASCSCGKLWNSNDGKIWTILRQNAHHTSALSGEENRVMKPVHRWGLLGGHNWCKGQSEIGKRHGIFNDHRDDVDSPIQVAQRRRAPLISLEESGDEQLSDQDFKDSLLRRPRRPRPHRNSTPPHGAKVAIRAAREFLDEEAELSEEGGAVSSDEACDLSEELDHSLAGFVVDNIQPSQGLNDSAMRGVYLKSVRSPAVHNKYKMVYKPSYDLEVCSQVTEQDESYMEDSFVVQGGEEEEEEPGDSDEEEVCAVELLPDDTCIGGRKLYPTRRRVRLRRAQGLERGAELLAREVKKPKASRIIVPEDTSEEEEESPLMRPPVFKTPQPEERGTAKTLQLYVTDVMIPGCSGVGQGSRPPLSQPVCILADSRGIAGGPEVLSCLRLRHGVTTQVCSLGACDFIVSNRMAVERQTLSEISSSVNRGRLAERVRALQGSFDRVCLIVEKDRTKPGEVSRVFQRSRYYDSTLAALIRAGTRLLFSSGPEDTAALLAELARVEQRKSNAIAVPTEVKGQRHQTLQFYLTLPGVSYITALNMCHRFSSVWHLVNSAVEELAAGACVSRPRAEEIFRCLRYAFHPDLLPHRPAGGAKSSGL